VDVGAATAELTRASKIAGRILSAQNMPDEVQDT
jgi:hypothetical protein